MLLNRSASQATVDAVPIGEVGDLAALLREAALSWQADGSVQATLQAVATAAAGTVPGVDYAGVSLIEAPHTVTTSAASDHLVRIADTEQSTLGEGPCVDALRQCHTVRVGDLGNDLRWPAFGPKAVALGVRSMLTFRLFSRGDRWGALNLYSGKASAFTDAAEFVGLVFASHAAIGLAGCQEIAQLNEALATRDLIGQAKGILVERHKITADAAFGMLVSTSQRSRRKLVDVAAWLVNTGEEIARQR
jgi:GAF domain-containing protein